MIANPRRWAGGLARDWRSARDTRVLTPSRVQALLRARRRNDGSNGRRTSRRRYSRASSRYVRCWRMRRAAAEAWDRSGGRGDARGGGAFRGFQGAGVGGHEIDLRAAMGCSLGPRSDRPSTRRSPPRACAEALAATQRDMVEEDRAAAAEGGRLFYLRARERWKGRRRRGGTRRTARR